MSVETRLELQRLLQYVKEGEVLYDEATSRQEKADVFINSEDESESSDSVMMTPCVHMSCADPPALLEKMCDADRVLQRGLEVHRKARAIIDESNANPAFTFALLHC
ncbi:uncharacterized protein TM35_000201090 [Trypanosoma theileri]|uniref:Uncharacterized protein n=1 Tax=Trypanosoma theileri TaxID=67003 RepID=A0A1X0NUC0_9TRYP|nr:uncharacterized protein TM35_000201090 [Trypanosoma theileri]ORC87700.1 hypothetical protein TM35_000201090 [Trypanosoma theileri]